MLMPMKIEDGNVLYNDMKVLIPNLSHRFSDLTRRLFAGYEAKGWRYLFETDSSEQPLEENAVGAYLFESIASNIYTTILPYVSKDGELTNGISMFLTETKTYEIKKTDTGSSTTQNVNNEKNNRENRDTSNSNSNRVDENSPINGEINEIVSPTFKNIQSSSDSSNRNETIERASNSSGNNSYDTTKIDTYSETFDRNETSPEYMKNYFEIRNYLIDCIKREVEKYVYECRLIY